MNRLKHQKEKRSMDHFWSFATRAFGAAPVSYEVRNSLKRTKGWNGKTVTVSRASFDAALSLDPRDWVRP